MTVIVVFVIFASLMFDCFFVFVFYKILPHYNVLQVRSLYVVLFQTKRDFSVHLRYCKPETAVVLFHILTGNVTKFVSWKV